MATLGAGTSTIARTAASAPHRLARFAPAASRFSGLGRRYSRFVALMRFMLPLVALTLVGAIIIWPQSQHRPEGFRLAIADFNVPDQGGQRLVNARYTGMDGRNQPYAVTADTASQIEAGQAAVALTQPKADITLDDGTWLALTANSGTFQREAQILELSGGVNLFHDAGYEFRTESALIDLGMGAAYGEDRIDGQGPFGSLSADGFQILERGQRILFTGKTRLVIHPEAEKARR